MVAALAACGDNATGEAEAPEQGGRLAVVGHHDLGARGMNSAIAIADHVAYVGSRIDGRGIAILDISRPTVPVQVGEIPGLVGMSSRELRAVPDLDLLVVLSLRCAPDLHGCSPTGGAPEGLELYDISDREAPVLVATYPIAGTRFAPRSPHEFYLRRDGERVLLFVAAPPAEPALEIVDVSDPRNPVKVTSWSSGISPESNDDVLHSVALSLDGRHAFLSHERSGLYLADISALPAITLVTPEAAAFDIAPPAAVGPHSTVQVPGRDLVLVTEEVYPPPYSTGCPWGKLHLVDIANPAAPVEVGSYGLPENDPAICATSSFDRITFTAHNATATRDLAFVTWHAGGLQVIDLSDATAPRQVTEFRPEPLASVAVEDPALGGLPVEMWSYPILKDGLVYVVDVRNGLYILRYDGIHVEQVIAEDFAEGNSNL